MDYTTYESLHEIIRNTISNKYTLAVANITFLEELESKNFVVYITQLRDAFTHLMNIYSVDIFTRKSYVLEQLERVNGHLERIVIDTYRKICDYFLKTIRNTKRRKDIPAFELQIAMKVRDLRLSNESMTFDKKRDGFQEIIEYMENIINSK